MNSKKIVQLIKKSKNNLIAWRKNEDYYVSNEQWIIKVNEAKALGAVVEILGRLPEENKFIKKYYKNYYSNQEAKSMQDKWDELVEKGKITAQITKWAKAIDEKKIARLVVSKEGNDYGFFDEKYLQPFLSDTVEIKLGSISNDKKVQENTMAVIYEQDNPVAVICGMINIEIDFPTKICEEKVNTKVI